MSIILIIDFVFQNADKLNLDFVSIFLPLYFSLFFLSLKFCIIVHRFAHESEK